MGLRAKRKDGPIEKPDRRVREGYPAHPPYGFSSPQGHAPAHTPPFWSGAASESVSRTFPIPRAAPDLAAGGKEAPLYL